MHIALVILVHINDVQLGFGLIHELTLLRLEHKVQHIRRIVVQHIQSICEVKRLLHAEFLRKLYLFELVDHLVLATTAQVLYLMN